MSRAKHRWLAVSLTLACVLLCLAAAGLGQEWRGKAAAEWTLEDVLEILRHSPWAQDRFILIPTGRTTQYPVAVGQKRVYSGSAVPERLPAVYLVRWESAATVEQAFARLAALGEATVADFLAQPPRLHGDYYVISVKTKEPPQPGRYELFARFKHEELRQRAELKAEHGATVQPKLVLRTGMGATAALHFYFPRRLEARPLLASSDAWVEFRFRGRQTAELRARFRLEDIGVTPGSPSP